MTNGTIPAILAAEYDIVLPTWTVAIFLGVAAIAAVVVLVIVRRNR